MLLAVVIAILAGLHLLFGGFYFLFPPQPHNFVARVAAFVFIVAVVALFAVEMGWGGGDPNQR